MYVEDRQICSQSLPVGKHVKHQLFELRHYPSDEDVELTVTNRKTRIAPALPSCGCAARCQRNAHTHAHKTFSDQLKLSTHKTLCQSTGHSSDILPIQGVFSLKITIKKFIIEFIGIILQ